MNTQTGAGVEASAASATMDGAVVSGREITRRYGEGETAVDALRGVSLDIEKGKLTAVMGPSGSGKSTLMHILAGLDRPTSGDVTIAGTNITKLDDNDLTKLRREHIGFVFQFFNLLPMLSAEENVTLPLLIAGEKPEHPWFDQLIEKVGLKDRLSHRPSELSGGQQQRVAIARALVNDPHIVLADEPTGNLDPDLSLEIMNLFRDMNARGTTVLVATHDRELIKWVGRRVIHLDQGHLKEPAL